MARRSSSRSRVRDRPIPFQQGSLDALCGIYAIVNAMSFLCPELDGDDSRALFARLVRKLKTIRRKALRSLWRGLNLGHVRKLLRHAEGWVARRLGPELSVKRIRHKLRKAPRLSSLWHELRRELGDGTIAIIGIGGLEAHWSVAIRTGRTWLKLIDSDGLTALKRSTCAVAPCARRYVLDPHEILLVRRVKTKA
jgi:hypothetical protein